MNIPYCSIFFPYCSISKKYCINGNLVSLNSAAYKGSTLLLSMGPGL